ncbi:hypothetical protein F5X99DRAFT_430511 [Biscogniauxia marginata]|nr:hypothetical protein F5X99DRAFT_430511 [Biscogniauxia marginata]
METKECVHELLIQGHATDAGHVCGKRNFDTLSIDNVGKRKMQKTSMPRHLSPNVRSIIISHALDMNPMCALDFLVPDWNICRRKNPVLEKVLEITRIVTYTQAVDGQNSTLSINFGHDEQDHILLPMKQFDDRLATLDKWCCNEVSRDFYRGNTHVFQLTTSEFLDDITNGSLLLNSRMFPLRGKQAQDILPFDDEGPGTKRLCASMATPIFTQLRHIAIRSPLSLTGIDATNICMPYHIRADALPTLNRLIDVDRSAHLRLSWSQMPQLESVLLDLRIYSHEINTELSKDHVIERAQEMGRHLNLKLLVIAGLQSYIFETSYESITAREVEEEDTIDNEPNFIKIFKPSLRPGGRIILIDRVIDEQPRLPVWRNTGELH